MKSEKFDKKKEQIVEASIELFVKKGMEKSSLADILEAASISKGTFYHYFKTKDDLLDEIIKKINLALIEPMNRILENNELDAPAKFRAWFSHEQLIKGAQQSLMIEFMKHIYAEHNLKLRRKYQSQTIEQLIPFFAKIIEQGKDEGTISISDPENAAFLIVQLGICVRERSIEKSLAGEATIEGMHKEIHAYEVAVERILGTTPGQIKLYDIEYISKYVLEN